MATIVPARYRCTQTELYPICRLGWNIAKKFQVDIALMFPEYTTTYIDDQLIAVKKAEDLPDFQARDSASESAHIILGQTAQPAINSWRLLERYINRVFKNNKDLIKPNIEAAGSNYYEAATRDNPNWEDLQQMLLSGQSYITNNLGILTPVMSATFQADYDSRKTDFDKQYDIFIQTEALNPEATAEKINANNNIYDELMFMLADIQSLIPAIEEIQNQATFTHLKSLISSPGSAGLKGTITEQGTDIKLKDVILRLTELGKEVTTGADGKYDFGNIASGKYKLQISLDGYQTLNTEVKIDVGVTSTKDYALVKNP